MALPHEPLYEQEGLSCDSRYIAVAILGEEASRKTPQGSLLHDSETWDIRTRSTPFPAKIQNGVYVSVHGSRRPDTVGQHRPRRFHFLLENRLPCGTGTSRHGPKGVTMSIGGYDILLLAPSDEAVGDVILRTTWRHWPDCVFQAANDEKVHRLNEPWVWQVGTAQSEFFIYRNKHAADRWEAEGATRRNLETMLYFLVKRNSDDSTICFVTLVCGKVTGSVRKLVEELQTGFLSLKPIAA